MVEPAVSPVAPPRRPRFVIAGPRPLRPCLVESHPPHDYPNFSTIPPQTAVNTPDCGEPPDTRTWLAQAAGSGADQHLAVKPAETDSVLLL
jgi:hypothetical protein